MAKVATANGKKFTFDDSVTPEQMSVVIDEFFSPESTLGEKVVGGLETAAAIGSAAIAEPIAGAAGALTALVPGLAEGSGAGVVEGVRENLSFQPRTQEGKGQLQAVGETLAPLGEAFDEFGKGLGSATLDATGSPVLAAAAETLPTAALEATGLAAASALPKAISRFKQQSPTKQRIAKLLDEGSTDIETSRFKLKESIDGEQPRIVKDKAAVETINQGFDEGVVAAVKGSSAVDKSKMLQMVDIMEKGKRNSRFAAVNRPGDIAGDSLLERFRVVRQANRKAGKELDSVANSLKGQQVDSAPAVNSFLDDLDSIGVSLGDDLAPNFKGSDIEGLAAPEAAINRIVKRMTSKTRAPDAFELHRLKRFIDETVSFGKGGEGLTGRTEGIMKSLRRNLDQTLDSKFPAYDKVNTTYSETIGAIDSLQDVAGKKLNLTGKNADKATGTLMRRLMSNAQSRVTLLDAIEEIEQVAKRNGGKFSDDLLTQTLFTDELDNVFGAVARTSLQGQIDQGVRAAARGDLAGAAVDVVAKGAEQVIQGRKNQEAAFKSIKDLLNSGKAP